MWSNIKKETGSNLGRYAERKNGNSSTCFPTVFPTTSGPYGLPYGKWTANWWKWALSIPINKNPLIDSTGEYCAEAQNGPVWFLAGTTGKTHLAERRCYIPSSKSILFPIIVSQFSFCELPFVKTVRELISCTTKDIDRCSLLEATIDGILLQDLSKYRIQFGPFDLFLPDNNIWDLKPGYTKAVSDGYWVFLQPLSKGSHTINFHGIEPNFETKVTYHLTIT